MIRKISIVIFLVAGLLFFMPWVAISCAGTRIIEIDGSQFVTGTNVTTPDILGTSGTTQIIDPSPWAIGALVAVVVGIILCLFRGRFASVLRALTGLVGAALIFGLKLNIDSNIASQGQQVGIVRVEYLPGFWMALGTLGLAGILALLEANSAKPLERGTKPPANISV